MGLEAIRAVLLDWEGTLAYFGSTCERICRQMAVVGPFYSTESVAAAILKREELITRGLCRGELKPVTRWEIVHFYQQLLVLLGETDCSLDRAGCIYRAFGQLVPTFYPDSVAGLRTLSTSGLKLGIISNTGIASRPSIQAATRGVINPRHIIISEEEGVHKPCKTIFHIAAQRLGIPPENCLFVGDNLDVDAIGSVQNGKYAIGLWLDRDNRETGREVPGGVFRITSIAQINDFCCLDNHAQKFDDRKAIDRANKREGFDSMVYNKKNPILIHMGKNARPDIAWSLKPENSAH